MRLVFSVLKLILLLVLIYNIGVGRVAHGLAETARQVSEACKVVEKSFGSVEGLVKGDGQETETAAQ